MPASRSWRAAREVGAKPSTDIATLFRSLADTFQGRSFARARPSLQSLNSIAGSENFLDDPALCWIQMRARLSERNGLLNGHELRSAAPSVQDSLDDLSFCLDGLSRREPAGRIVLFPGNNAELAGGDTRLEAGADLRVGRLSHAPAHGIDEEGALIHDGLALKAAVAGKGQSRVRLAASVPRSVFPAPGLRRRCCASATTWSA